MDDAHRAPGLFVVVTVDVESPQTPFRRGLYKQELLSLVSGADALGYALVMSMLARQGIRAVFFVNVYESTMWGERRICSICEEIYAGGHEIGLHTHPEWAYDRARVHMWQYSVEEQTRIVADGLQMLRRWVPDCRIVSHRAGAYGINEATIGALRENDLPVDSSMHYGHGNCKVNWSRNSIVTKEGIVEVPLTVYTRTHRVTLGGLPVWTRNRTTKTGVGSAVATVVPWFLAQAKQHGIRFINLMLHSYSFVRFAPGDYGTFERDGRRIEAFEELLTVLSRDPDVEFTTLADMHDLHLKCPGALAGSDCVPIYETRVPFLQALGSRLWRLACRRPATL